jgi:prepilin-type processing-associated H-X9-DG protein
MVFGALPSPKLDAIQDGTTKTIFFAEKTPSCTGLTQPSDPTAPASNIASGASAIGGNLWSMPHYFGSGTVQTTIYNYAGEFGFADSLSGTPVPVYPVSKMPNVQFGPLSPPQVAFPLAYDWTRLYQQQPQVGSCDPTLASTPHPGGINVAMGDGSVKFVSNQVSWKTWLAAQTPGPVIGVTYIPPAKALSDILGADWGD